MLTNFGYVFSLESQRRGQSQFNLSFLNYILKIMKRIEFCRWSNFFIIRSFLFFLLMTILVVASLFQLLVLLKGELFVINLEFFTILIHYNQRTRSSSLMFNLSKIFHLRFHSNEVFLLFSWLLILRNLFHNI